ncbi:PREDICTED: rho GTPase-activating protein 5-like [Camelina sativa]|uniref:Rho GTPase-activating protein 5-like n=1 Tax=Camelina sativa TaxID=90675 RepID=A0ABM1R318_CAMSA|nr:PREDICTED: rho GTPase-activating protein 5-like [Camelina sativa]
MAEDSERQSMDIGRPTNICHVAHVTYDRFDGFLGLPSEFEPDVPKKPPSASDVLASYDLFIYLRVCSATVFGVSTESMQLSYDSRGNCVPTILTLLQSRLYDQGGLQVEGIFRITGDNSEEEFIREELNKGVLPEGVDIHCLAGLIKAWFRELPRGILDPLPSQQVMQCESEEDFVKVVRLLPQTEASLLNWAINLMADFVEFEDVNKMTSRNLALVFAPNMSQMADPLTALMYAVQVMNLLRNLIDKTLRERKIASSHVDPCDNISEAEDNQQEEMYIFEEEEDEDIDEKDKEDETIKESGIKTLLADEHISSSEVNTNDQKKQET